MVSDGARPVQRSTNLLGKIGVITPYRSQMKLLKDMVMKLLPKATPFVEIKYVQADALRYVNP